VSKPSSKRVISGLSIWLARNSNSFGISADSEKQKREAGTSYIFTDSFKSYRSGGRAASRRNCVYDPQFATLELEHRWAKTLCWC